MFWQKQNALCLAPCLLAADIVKIINKNDIDNYFDKKVK